MEKFIQLKSIAAPLPIVNIDTDMIIPKVYLKTVKRTGLGIGLFAEIRYHQDGSENADFILNKSAYRHAKILVAGDNFGCGSSREHAAWSLIDFGIRCIISTSFADIFYNNCFKNGILPVRVTSEELEQLLKGASCGMILTINLQTMKIYREVGGPIIKFDLDEFHRHCLLNGLDDIDLTMRKVSKINAFEKHHKRIYPWY
ncbi:MAG: 3-isopropylmalate/(R)-2-methylmalate dehydratase small subunit [Candidatus Tokpelaia sp. JSC085]|nr:MAG: 3-isopropylmalate/(R)-2-methylmalate dehydratase small subunit [Candidatus Tokpelaia sp. JSC085]